MEEYSWDPARGLALVGLFGAVMGGPVGLAESLTETSINQTVESRIGKLAAGTAFGAAWRRMVEWKPAMRGGKAGFAAAAAAIVVDAGMDLACQ